TSSVKNWTQALTFSDICEPFEDYIVIRERISRISVKTTHVSYFRSFAGQDKLGSSATDLAMKSQRPSRVHSAAWCRVPEVSEASMVTVASETVVISLLRVGKFERKTRSSLL